MKDETSLRQQYESLRPSLERLGDNLRHALRTFLTASDIDVLDVTYRIKVFTSFAEKLERKQYKKPFEETQDLCGLRIVVFYPSDLSRVDQIIRDEFVVVDSQDKQEMLAPDRFGYRSNHYVVKVKPDWLNAPNYRGLADCVAEIQVRTILMHAWADLSHKLAYKEESQIPQEFRRQVNQLSALFELADQQFDRLREERASYRQNLSSDAKGEATHSFDLSVALNLDSLQAFLAFYFGDREAADKDISDLLADLNRVGVTLRDIAAGYEQIREILLTHEKESFGENDRRWRQVGVVRHILDVTNDKWWKTRKFNVPPEVSELITGQRKELQKHTTKDAKGPRRERKN